ncbi:MAG: TrmH family RNA methyltransferase [Bacteroidales bacterium]|nr:TrmH family RNA methyltransferase [Candidatus Physcousia equi]
MLNFQSQTAVRKLKVTEMNRLSQQEFREAEKTPLIVVLDNVRSIYNIGSVFRTCDAFRIKRLCLCGVCACPPNVEIHKTALGAEDSVEWVYYADTMDCIRDLQSEGCTILAVEQCEGSTLLHHFSPEWRDGADAVDAAAGERKTYAVVLGNEVKGVQQEVVDACDGCLEIQQFGTKHSMNVSVTAGIIMWQFVQQLM